MMSRTRRSVLWFSSLLAVGGWGGSLACYLSHGHHSGVMPSFIAALTIGAAFTIVAGQAAILPDTARLYALGHRDGQATRKEVSPPRHLHSVR